MIRPASAEDAHLVYKIMLSAFEEYRNSDTPSGALAETVSSIEEALRNGSEMALLYYLNGVPAGTVRFRTDNNSLYFFRLSVIPEARNRGIAKAMLAWLENYAKEHGLNEIWCKVRKSVPRNIRLYESAGFIVFREETKTSSSGATIQIISMKKKIS